jgi:hypothetical protein
MHIQFGSDSLKERHHLEDLDVESRITLKWILKDIKWETSDLINQSHSMVQWRDLVNTVMNLRVT